MSGKKDRDKHTKEGEWQNCQVSDILRETHALQCCLTLTRITSHILEFKSCFTSAQYQRTSKLDHGPLEFANSSAITNSDQLEVQCVGAVMAILLITDNSFGPSWWNNM